jgi:hypothetical protein
MLRFCPCSPVRQREPVRPGLTVSIAYWPGIAFLQLRSWCRSSSAGWDPLLLLQLPPGLPAGTGTAGPYGQHSLLAGDRFSSAALLVSLLLGWLGSASAPAAAARSTGGSRYGRALRSAKSAGRADRFSSALLLVSQLLGWPGCSASAPAAAARSTGGTRIGRG